MKPLPALVLLASVSAIHAQGPAESPAFEVASVKPSPPAERFPFSFAGDMQPSGRWSAQRMPAAQLVMRAYGMVREQVLGGPSWIDTEPFDVNARAAPGTTGDELRLMLRQLLADRFRLQTRAERRPVRVYALVLARDDGRLGPGLRPAATGCDTAGSRSGAASTGDGLPPCVTQDIVDGVMRLRLRNQPLSMLLGLTLVSGALGASVVDRTGLAGTFDVDLNYRPSPILATSGPVGSGVPAPAAIEGQLGLTFERREEPMDVIVIERVARPEPD